MKRIIMLISILLFSASAVCGCAGSSDKPSGNGENYLNPVWEPVLADPSIIRHEGIYYVFGTQDDGKWEGEQGVQYGKQYIPILKSDNLVNWKYAGSVFDYSTAPKWATLNAGLWAPDIVKIKDKFLLYYSMSVWGDPDPGIGVATADHPLGPWTDRGELLRSKTIGVNNSIDPSVFTGNDGKIYIVWGSFRGLYGAELTADGLGFVDGGQSDVRKTHIAGYDTSVQWSGDTYEAAYVIFKDNYYYLFASSGTCCNGHKSTYHVRVGRSKYPLGPYVDHENKSMLGGGRGSVVVAGSERFSGTGHNAVTTDDEGNYYIVYHAYDNSQPEKYGNSPRRSLLIDKLVWDSNGWPYVAGLKPSETAPAPVIRTKNR